MLSSFLGPAKPPIATAEDVAAAGGLFRLIESEDGLKARCLEGPGTLCVARSERCLICLEEYCNEEQTRQLAKCSHMFHQTCIDEVCYN